MRRRGGALLTLGLALVALAAALSLYNVLDARRAARAAALAAQQVRAEIAAARAEDSAQPEPARPEAEKPGAQREAAAPADEAPDEVAPDGTEYLGLLSIPALGLELPVAVEYSDAQLRSTPCRYSGSALTEDLVIAGHNYRGHFGALSSLRVGDAVTVTCMDGEALFYTVAAFEVLQPNEAEALTAGTWALTLFTCTPGGRERLAVRCSPA